MRKIFLFALVIIIFSTNVFAERLPTVNSDSGSWGTILNSYLEKLSGANATELNTTMVNGTNIYESQINTSHILDSTILEEDLNIDLNNSYVKIAGGDTITSGIIIEGELNITQGINLSQYTSCTALETDANGNLVCGSDDSGSANLDVASILWNNETSNVNTTHILDRTIGLDDINDDSVNTTHIEDSTITADDIANAVITAAKLVVRLITSDYIADSAVNTTHIEDSTILDDDLDLTDITLTDLTDDVGYLNVVDDINSTMLNNSYARTDSIVHFTQNVSFGDNLTIGDNFVYVDTSVSRIGIGNSTPDVMLHLGGESSDGKIKVCSAAGRCSVFEAFDGGHFMHLGSLTNHDFHFVRNNISRFYIDGTYHYFRNSTGDNVLGVDDNGNLLYVDTAGNFRYGLWYPGNNEVRLSSRGSDGFVQIAANTGTGGGGGEKIVARFEDDNVNVYTNLNVTDNLTVQSIHEVNLDGDGAATYSETQYLRNYILEINNTMSHDAVMIPNDILANYCGDIDGCMLRGIMKNYDANNIPVSGGTMLFGYDTSNYKMRIQNTDAGGVVEATDGDSTETNLWNVAAWSSCFLTDYNIIAGVTQDDSEYGVWWHWDTAAYNVAQRSCILVIED